MSVISSIIPCLSRYTISVLPFAHRSTRTMRLSLAYAIFYARSTHILSLAESFS
jgi:hypothetical protein